MTAPGWVSLNGQRQGLMTHGTYLSVGASVNLTSPTRRGNEVLKRLTCSPFEPPSVALMAVMQVPPRMPGQCKTEWWNMQEQADCAGCHTQMDPIGFGLERFGPLGEYREVEDDTPTCAIDGTGMIRGEPFAGPVELSQMLVQGGMGAGVFPRALLRVHRRPSSGSRIRRCDLGHPRRSLRRER